MSLWKPASIQDEPEVILADWSVMEASFDDGEKSHHFVGTRVGDGFSGRVSSKIVEFDKDTMMGKTRSGRVYKLEGLPGHSRNGAYVWVHWASINQVTEFNDVSVEYCSTPEMIDAATAEVDAS